MKKLFFLLLISFYTNSQILKDPMARNWIIEGLNKSYNYEFAEAAEIYQKIKVKYPNNPTYNTLMHMMLYTQYAPVADNPKAKQQYIFHLNKSVELAEKMTEKKDNDTESVFFMLSSLGSLAAWQADNGDMMKAVNTARRAFPYMKKGMKLTDVQADFLFTTGLYNYYIEQYPEDHPIVKPFMLFFSDGNKKLGLSQLESCSSKALFTYAEAAYYSAYVYLKHESRPDKALIHITNLLQKYPNNILYKTRKAESLIGLNRFDLALPIVDELIKNTGRIYPMAGLLFKATIEEKHLKNEKNAVEYYKKALKIPMDERYTKDYHAMAYLGLGRIAFNEKNNSLAKVYLKKVLDLSEYQSVISETNKLLKKL